MKEYLKIFNLLILSLFLSLPLFAKDIDIQRLHPDFNITEGVKSLRLIFIKDNKSAREVFTIDENNKKEYIKNINDDEVVSVFQGDGITEGNSVYLITRSKVQNDSRSGYYYNITELPIIDTESGISVKFFQGDPSPPELINCFDGTINGEVVTCKYKVAPQIKEYITKLHAKKECQPLTFKDENGNDDIYRSGTRCFYQNKNLLDSYQKYREENINNEAGKYLMRELTIGKNTEDNLSSVGLNISYKWLNNNSLNIVLSFPGGVTTLTFEEKPNGTIINTIYDAD